MFPYVSYIFLQLSPLFPSAGAQQRGHLVAAHRDAAQSDPVAAHGDGDGLGALGEPRLKVLKDVDIRSVEKINSYHFYILIQFYNVLYTFFNKSIFVSIYMCVCIWLYAYVFECLCDISHHATDVIYICIINIYIIIYTWKHQPEISTGGYIIYL